MFDSLELVFDSLELVFDSLELMFQSLEHRFIHNCRVNASNFLPFNI